MGNDNSKTTCDKSHVFRQEWQAANIIGIHEIINQRVRTLLSLHYIQIYYIGRIIV